MANSFNEHQNSPAWQKQRIQKGLERLRAKAGSEHSMRNAIDDLGGRTRFADDKEILEALERELHDLENRAGG